MVVHPGTDYLHTKYQRLNLAYINGNQQGDNHWTQYDFRHRAYALTLSLALFTLTLKQKEVFLFREPKGEWEGRVVEFCGWHVAWSREGTQVECLTAK